jgi:hypothetical protein
MNKYKVIVRKLDGKMVKGYVETGSDLTQADNTTVALLTEERIQIPKREMKSLFFVRKFSGDKEYQEVKFFGNHPKIHGLLVRLTFYDGELIEGLMANSTRAFLEDGFYLTPLDPNSNNWLIYVVKGALKEFMVVGLQYCKREIGNSFAKSGGVEERDSSAGTSGCRLAG